MTNLYIDAAKRLTLFQNGSAKKMRSPIHTLRFVPIICILATFPALGQVENAADDRFTQAASLDAARASSSLAPADSADIAPPEIRAPRLAPAAPRLPTVLPVIRVAQASRAAPTPQPVVVPTAYDRIAALSAVPLTQPPIRAEPPKGGVVNEALATATAWAAVAQTYLHAYWREVGLIAAMVILSGLLFWRLGERSRHADQELVLDFDAMPLVDGVVGRPVEELLVPAAPVDRVVLIEPEIEPDGLPLPAPAAAAEAFVLEETRSQHRFNTLHDAIAAMKADTSPGDPTRKSAVSA